MNSLRGSERKQIKNNLGATGKRNYTRTVLVSPGLL